LRSRPSQGGTSPWPTESSQGFVGSGLKV
jgi:hypothetical protein